MSEIKLSELARGEKGIIDRLNCSSELGARLSELGLIAGNEVLMKRSAIFGGPIQIYVGYDLLLRKSEADYILVKRI